MLLPVGSPQILSILGSQCPCLLQTVVILTILHPLWAAVQQAIINLVPSSVLLNNVAVHGVGRGITISCLCVHIRHKPSQLSQYAYQASILQSPKYFTSSMFGSHSPFPIHVVVLGPLSTSPGGQPKITLVPSIAGCRFVPLNSMMIDSSVRFKGYPQATIIIICKKKQIEGHHFMI